MSIQRIVVGVDESDGAAAALRWAADLAASCRAEVIAVRAINPDTPVSWAPDMGAVAALRVSDEDWRARREEAEERLERRSSAILRRARVPHRTVVIDGHPAAALMGMAEAENADLIVVGRHHRGGLAGLVLGRVGRRLTRDARCPVLVVPTVTDTTVARIIAMTSATRTPADWRGTEQRLARPVAPHGRARHSRRTRLRVV